MTPDGDAPPAPDTGARPFPDSLCWGCALHRVVRSSRSVFLKCEGLPVKYPRQPVAACPAFQRAAAIRSE